MSEEFVRTEHSEPQESLPTSTERETVAGVKHKRLHSMVEYLKTILVTLVVALLLKTFVIEAFRIPSGSMENTLLVEDFLFVNKLAYGIRTPRYVPLTNLAIPTMFAPVFKKVQRGDVVIFEFPGNPDPATSEQVNFVKRCIGLPGDVVEIREGKVFVNGREVTLPSQAKFSVRGKTTNWNRNYRMFPPGLHFTPENYGPLTVPKEGMLIDLSPATINQWRRLIRSEGHRMREDGFGNILIDGQVQTQYRVEGNHYFVLGDNSENSLDSRYWGFVPEKNLIGEALFIYWSWDTDLPAASLADKLKIIRWERIGTIVR